MTTNTHVDVGKLKEAAAGRWPEIIAAICPVDDALLDGKHHPCPKCVDGGTDRFRVFNDFEQTGGCICSTCCEKANGDGLATVQWLNGCDFRTAIKSVAGYLGITGDHKREPVEIVADIAQRKRIPLEEFKAYGAHESKRGKLTVCRLPLYAADGTPCSEFDLATVDDKWLKGLAAGGKPAGVFLKNATAPKSGDTVCIVEGVKDAAALSSLGYQVVGLCGKQLGKKFVSMFRGCRVIIIPDRDLPGDTGARKTASRLAGHVKSVLIAALPGELKTKDGDGVREVLAQRDGEAAVRKAIEVAQPWSPHERDPDDNRPEILITTDEHVVNAAAAKAIGADRTMFQRDGRLVHVVQHATLKDDIERPGGAPKIVELPEPLLRDRLSANIRFVEEVGDGLMPANPPGWCVKAVHSCGNWPEVRPLLGVTAFPVLRPDGTILAEAGYDIATGLFYQPMGNTPEIPDDPTKDDALQALEKLFDITAEFPFDSPAHRSAWVAALLTPAARPAFKGPSPLFLVDANAAGSGKGLLLNVTSTILTHRDMSVTSTPSSDDEFRKRITAVADAGDAIVLLDNIASSLGCASLDAALTSTQWNDRLLGKTKMVDVPLRATWFATGNNVVLKGDTSRRVCHIRLNSTVENPEERDGFKYPDLLLYVREHQQELLGAVLTILRAWFVAGKPNAKLKTWGSYEGWSHVVRNAVVWLGLPDPGETRRELRLRSDNTSAGHRAMIAGWEELDPDRTGYTATEALQRVESSEGLDQLRSALLEYCPGRDGKLPTARSLGMKLNHLTKTIAGGKFFDSRSAKNMKIWFVQDADQGGTKGTNGTNSHTFTRENNIGTHACTRPRVEGTENSPTSPTSPTPIGDFRQTAGNGEIRHKDSGCQSTDSWLHRTAGRHCSICWPCTDPAMMLAEVEA